MGQIYMNNESPSVLTHTLRLSDRILSEVPLYEFRCNMDISAADMAAQAFLGGAAGESEDSASADVSDR